MRIFLSAILATALVATPVFAHGGQYKGPADAGSGSGQSGGTVAPPTNPGGAAAPGPGAAASGGASSGATRTGTGRVARGGSGRRGATTSAGATEDTKGFEIWEFWWENNKDRFLNLKGRLSKTSNVSGSAGLLTGRGRKAASSSTRRPDQTMIDTDVIPSLIGLLSSSDDMNILDSAVLALGRTATVTLADSVAEAAIPLLSNKNLSVQSSTALALGVLRSPTAVQNLQEILQDSSAGRRMTGGGNIHWLVRAFSGLSLGLIGDESGIDSLMSVVERLGDTEKDIKICSIVGLGLVPADHPRAEAVKDFLLGQLDNRRLDPLIKSFIPTSLGKLGLPSAVPALLATFTDRDTDNIVLQSAAIGLGQLATVGDTEVVEALTKFIEEGKDSQTRHFSLISLAQIGARDEDFETNKSFHDDMYSLFAKEMQGKGKQQGHRSWAGIAAAIYSKPHTEIQPKVIDRLVAAYDDESDPSFKSAFAVALGLLDAKSAGDMIFADFNRNKEQDFRGYAGVALGFLQYDEAADALRGLCQNKATSPTLRLQAATGLGLMSDTQAVSTLIETLEGAQTLGVSSAVAKALGLIGDSDSISPLKEIALKDGKNPITRAFACVALGLVGEKTDLPWNASISANNNYRAKTPSIEEVLDIL